MKSKLSRDDVGVLIIILAMLFGGWLRFTPVLSANFPINDGGMFYVMIDDLIENGYVLPTFTTYNSLNIPYAYPPLPFYLAALLHDIFNIPLIQLLMWLPTSFATLGILAVYQLAKTITKDTLTSGLSAFLYALTPGATMWFLMGGGLTRSLGALFLLLMTASAIRLLRDQEQKQIILTMLWGSLTILSHPEMAIHAIGMGIFLFIFFFNKKNIASVFQVGLGVIVLTSPWWGTVLYYHGTNPLLRAPQTGYYNFLWVLQQVGIFQMVAEKFLTIVSVTGIFGLALLLNRKEYLIPLMLLVPYVDNPRNAGHVAIVIVCIAASIAFLEIILPRLLTPDSEKKTSGFVAKILTAYLFMIIIFGGYAQMDDFSQAHLPEASREALTWVKENTPKDAAFLILNGSRHPFFDPMLEWFPVLAERYSVSTIQGLEWIEGNHFFEYMENVMDVQQCYFQDIVCLQEKNLNLPEHNYLVLTKHCEGQPECQETEIKEITSPSTLAIDSLQYQVVFENENVVIYFKKHP